jgi:hypothetical protein
MNLAAASKEVNLSFSLLFLVTQGSILRFYQKQVTFNSLYVILDS